MSSGGTVPRRRAQTGRHRSTERAGVDHSAGHRAATLSGPSVASSGAAATEKTTSHTVGPRAAGTAPGRAVPAPCVGGEHPRREG